MKKVSLDTGAGLIRMAALAWAALLLAGCNQKAAMPLEGVWYKGDLHCHSTHSDGDGSVQEVIASAESRGLDYFVITDHDGNMGGIPTQWDDPDYRSDGLIMLYGVEWTTGPGHANVWASEPFDYGDLWLANRAEDARTAIEAAHAQNALFSVNHPAANLCCPWEYEAYEGIDSIEIWNAMYLLPNFNFISIRSFWDHQLLAGRRIPGVGGSDTHQLKGFEANFLRHAEPTTWVYAEEGTAESILAAIRAGHVSVSDEPEGPRIDFTADSEGDEVFETLMGDNVVLTEEADVTFKIRILSAYGGEAAGPTLDLSPELMTADEEEAGLTPDRLASAFLQEGEYLVVLRRNGDPHGLWKAMEDTAEIEITERITPDEQVFYRVELLGMPPADFLNTLLRGFFKAVSNPIYFNYPG
jgi:predicted metal-dependent phosphoesterase TrpH